MGEIVDKVAEFETVRRLAEMLGTAKEDYKTTESYALFTAILCWVMQRVRTPEHHDNLGDGHARSVGERLKEHRISEEPWQIGQFENMSAFDFFKHLRDSVAHGDRRRISPLNENSILVGHSFELRSHNGARLVGTVDLRRKDMRRLGIQLAELFCEAMSAVDEDKVLLAEGVSLGEEEAAA